jgi:hypothetical protein
LASGTEIEVDAVAEALTPDHLHAFLVAAGFDRHRALRIYLWNIELARTLILPTGTVEIVVRNALHTELVRTYGPNWPDSPSFLARLNRSARTSLSNARRRAGSQAFSSRLVSEISFDFWTGLFNVRHEEDLWTNGIRSAFPHSPPSCNRRELHNAVFRVKDLRNQVAHHRPIFGRNISADYGSMLRLIAWRSPDTARWVRTHTDVAGVLRRKP